MQNVEYNFLIWSFIFEEINLDYVLKNCLGTWYIFTRDILENEVSDKEILFHTFDFYFFIRNHSLLPSHVIAEHPE